MKRRHLPLFLLLFTLLGGVGPRSAAAHAGGTLQLANQSVGPYLMSLWTLPEPVRAGEQLHVSLFLLTPPSADGADQDFILDANVDVLATSPDGETQLRDRGLHIDPDDPFYYEADLAVDDGGSWDVTILVDGPDGSGELSFTVDVLPPERNLTWLYWVAGGLLVVIAGGLLYWRGASGARRA